jgi:hypothetical protein
MTREVCDVVVERVALGEPLGDAATHAASCARCRRLAALPVELAGARRADPGAGFSARIAVGARRRLVQRKRRKLAGGSLAIAATLAIGVFAATHASSSDVAPAPGATTMPTLAATTTPPQVPAIDRGTQLQPTPTAAGDRHVDPEVRELVRLAHTERSHHASAHWARIEKPLAPYRALAKGVTP